MSSVSCSLIFANQSTDPQPVAVIANYDEILQQINATGSIGDTVRGRVIRGGIIQETTAGEVNTGSNQIDYVTVLQNGDRLCVQATYSAFASYDEACGDIPTPEFGFIPIS